MVSHFWKTIPSCSSPVIDMTICLAKLFPVQKAAMGQVTIHEAKTHLSKLIQETIFGEDVIIAKGNK